MRESDIHPISPTTIQQSSSELSCPWVTVKGKNINIIYPSANTKHTGFMGRTLKLALPEGAQSLSNIKAIPWAPGMDCRSLSWGQPKPGIWSSERWRRSETLDSAQTKTS